MKQYLFIVSWRNKIIFVQKICHLKNFRQWIKVTMQDQPQEEYLLNLQEIISQRNFSVFLHRARQGSVPRYTGKKKIPPVLCFRYGCLEENIMVYQQRTSWYIFIRHYIICRDRTHRYELKMLWHFQKNMYLMENWKKHMNKSYRLILYG